jgi:hypothetical protein
MVVLFVRRKGMAEPSAPVRIDSEAAWIGPHGIQCVHCSINKNNHWSNLNKKLQRAQFPTWQPRRRRGARRRLRLPMELKCYSLRYIPQIFG